MQVTADTAPGDGYRAPPDRLVSVRLSADGHVCRFRHHDRPTAGRDHSAHPALQPHRRQDQVRDHRLRVHATRHTPHSLLNELRSPGATPGSRDVMDPDGHDRPRISIANMLSEVATSFLMVRSHRNRPAAFHFQRTLAKVSDHGERGGGRRETDRWRR